MTLKRFASFTIFYLAFVPGLAMATDCNDAVRSAMSCPSGYTMTCMTDGYEHWTCAKMVDGVAIPLDAGIPVQQHDTIETSKTGIAHKTVPVPKVATTTPAAKPVADKKPTTSGNATSAAAHEMAATDWRGGLPSFLQKILGYSAPVTSTTTKGAKGKMASSTPFLSNAYFAHLFKALMGK